MFMIRSQENKVISLLIGYDCKQKKDIILRSKIRHFLLGFATFRTTFVRYRDNPFNHVNSIGRDLCW